VFCSAATFGSCIKVTGTLVASKHDRQPVEVRAEMIEVVGGCHVMVSFYCAMLCIHGTSHGPVSVCHKSEFY